MSGFPPCSDAQIAAKPPGLLNAQEANKRQYGDPGKNRDCCEIRSPAHLARGVDPADPVNRAFERRAEVPDTMRRVPEDCREIAAEQRRDRCQDENESSQFEPAGRCRVRHMKKGNNIPRAAHRPNGRSGCRS
jgi:hypothetical protein